MIYYVTIENGVRTVKNWFNEEAPAGILISASDIDLVVSREFIEHYAGFYGFAPTLSHDEQWISVPCPICAMPIEEYREGQTKFQCNCDISAGQMNDIRAAFERKWRGEE